MNLYSISQLQQFSGVKHHTIRVWEQRYNALKPNRSDGNTRYYDSNQLRRLLNISSLIKEGFKVSKLCKMPDQDLFNLVSKNLESSNTTKLLLVDQLVSASTNFEEEYFNKVLNSSIKNIGLTKTYKEVLFPFLNRLGLLWASNEVSPAHEHFSSNLIKQKLFSAINELPEPSNEAKTWVLFLPPYEFHELSLLFAYYLIKQAGNKVIYLGSNIPLETLKQTIKKTMASHLLFFLVHKEKPEIAENFLEKLHTECKGQKTYFSGNYDMISQLKFDKSISWLKSVSDLELLINPSN